MALHQYLAEEIAQDCADGLLSRREAMRRLGLLGLSLSGAASLLAACGDDDDDDAAPGTTADRSTSTSSTTSTTEAGDDEAAAPAELIRFEGPDGELRGAYSAPGDPKGAVLVIHENRGLTPHFFDVVGRLATEGYATLCVDLLSAEGGTESLGDEGAAQAALAGASEERLLGDLGAGIDELERRAPGVSIGAVGFCFGGGMTWALLDAGERRLAAAVPFYGPAPDAPDFSGAEAAVLAVYAELDARVNASRQQAQDALEAAGLTHEVRTFPDVDHAFFNDTGPRYDDAAAREAYAALLAWFAQHLT